MQTDYAIQHIKEHIFTGNTLLSSKSEEFNTIVLREAYTNFNSHPDYKNKTFFISYSEEMKHNPQALFETLVTNTGYEIDKVLKYVNNHAFDDERSNFYESAFVIFLGEILLEDHQRPLLFFDQLHKILFHANYFLGGDTKLNQQNHDEIYEFYRQLLDENYQTLDLTYRSLFEKDPLYNLHNDLINKCLRTDAIHKKITLVGSTVYPTVEDYCIFGNHESPIWENIRKLELK
jgi:hypothetical protein